MGWKHSKCIYAADHRIFIPELFIMLMVVFKRKHLHQILKVQHKMSRITLQNDLRYSCHWAGRVIISDFTDIHWICTKIYSRKRDTVSWGLLTNKLEWRINCLWSHFMKHLQCAVSMLYCFVHVRSVLLLCFLKNSFRSKVFSVRQIQTPSAKNPASMCAERSMVSAWIEER